jgi:hypothetical protein
MSIVDGSAGIPVKPRAVAPKGDEVREEIDVRLRRHRDILRHARPAYRPEY